MWKQHTQYIPYHIICTTAFTIPRLLAVSSPKNQASVSQSVSEHSYYTKMAKCYSKDSLFSSSFSDLWWMFLLLRNTIFQSAFSSFVYKRRSVLTSFLRTKISHTLLCGKQREKVSTRDWLLCWWKNAQSQLSG